MLVRVSARFELSRVRVIGIGLYQLNFQRKAVNKADSTLETAAEREIYFFLKLLVILDLILTLIVRCFYYQFISLEEVTCFGKISMQI